MIAGSLRYNFAFAVNKKQGRVSFNGVLLSQFYSLSYFTIYSYIYKVGIIKNSCFSICKGLGF